MELSSRFHQNARFQAKAEILVEAGAQVCESLTFLQEVERADVILVVRAGQDFAGARLSELAITGVPVRDRGESWDDASSRRFGGGLTAIPPWHERIAREVAEAHTTGLSPLHGHAVAEDGIASFEGLDVGASEN